jgi:hypothetical protein
MQYVVYHNITLHIVAHCKTQAGALRSMAAHNRKLARAHAARSQADLGTNDYYTCTDQEHYDKHVNVMTTTYNMLDPERKPIAIRKADKGGCCDPATETYHSM